MIKASSAKEVDALVKDLASDDPIARDAATARLTIIGARAVERVAALAADGRLPAAARTAALRTLEGIADHRALDAALRLIDERDLPIAIAAVDVASTFVEDPHGLVAVDRLVAVVLDRTRPAPLRLAAFRALEHLDVRTLGPVREALKNDPSATLRSSTPGLATRGGGRRTEQLSRMLEEGALPGDPGLIGQALAAAATPIRLASLHALLERIREREQTGEASERTAWTVARGAVHAALRARGSLLGLYDLRESVASAREPLPPPFLAALSALGDDTCLESIAAAYSLQRGGPGDADRVRRRSSALDATVNAEWLHDLARAFAAIVKRENVTRRSAAIKKIERRWPSVLDALWPGKPRARAARR